MVCIFCDKKTSVTNSRASKKQPTVWRRRHCPSCQATWSTIEAVDWSTALKVQNSQTKLVNFQRHKLFISLYEALRHTPSAVNNAEALTNTVITQLQNQRTPIWKTSDIRSVCYKTLHAFNETSAGVYASLYR